MFWQFSNNFFEYIVFLCTGIVVNYFFSISVYSKSCIESRYSVYLETWRLYPPFIAINSSKTYTMHRSYNLNTPVIFQPIPIFYFIDANIKKIITLIYTWKSNEKHFHENKQKKLVWISYIVFVIVVEIHIFFFEKTFGVAQVLLIVCTVLIY